jgi:hypothetical protein
MEKTLRIFPYLLIADLKGFQNLRKFIFQFIAIFKEKLEKKRKKYEGRTGSTPLLFFTP